jgi:ABC-type transport system involved in multi-copper enzyme maturation permease subunit
VGRWRYLVLYSLGEFIILELMLVAAILYWPNFEANVDNLRALAAPIPALSDLLDTIEDTGILGYIAGQHFFKGCNTLGTAAAVLFAVGAVAGEVHRGTLEMLLSRPYSRLRILTERYVAGLVALSIPIFVTSLTIPALAERIGEIELLRPYLLGSLHQAIFLGAIYSLTFFLSCIGSNPTRIAIFVLFVTTLQFAIYMVKVVTHFSLYRLADIEVFVRIADRNALDPRIYVPLLGASVVLYGASVLAFQRRLP